MKRIIKLPAVLVGIFLIVSFIYSGVSFSAENSKDIDKLKQKITELEKRIKDLEAVLKIYHRPDVQKPGDTYGWSDKKSWRNLKEGMTRDQVKSLLGEPVKIIKGSKTIWYYPSFYDGVVSFDKNGKLTSWKEP